MRKKENKLLRRKLNDSAFRVISSIADEPDLIVIIGGDGTFLEAIHVLGFPKIPIIGINTGHLGFFQEIMPEMLDDFIFNYMHGNYSLQRMQSVRAVVEHDGTEEEFTGINEIVIASAANYAYSAHFNITSRTASRRVVTTPLMEIRTNGVMS